MQQNKPTYHPLLAKAELHENAIPIILFAYKYGIVEIPSDIGLLKKLSDLGWAKTNIARGQSLCMLTDNGAQWVEENLFQLAAFPLYLIYPMLVSGEDELQLLVDVKKSDLQYALNSPSMTMDRGRYFLGAINRGVITVIDDCDVPYRLNLKATKEILVLRPQQFGTLEEELKKRFHPIRIKSLTKRLCNSIPTLTLTEWVEELYYRRHTKWRIGGDNDGRNEE